MQGLRDLRVVDFSNRIAGAYATKLLADAYAEVIKVEPPDGDALRRWTASDQDLDGKDGALFQFLNTSKKSVVGAIGDDHVDAARAVSVARALFGRPVYEDEWITVFRQGAR